MCIFFIAAALLNVRTDILQQKGEDGEPIYQNLPAHTTKDSIAHTSSPTSHTQQPLLRQEGTLSYQKPPAPSLDPDPERSEPMSEGGDSTLATTTTAESVMSEGKIRGHVSRVAITNSR